MQIWQQRMIKLQLCYSRKMTYDFNDFISSVDEGVMIFLS